MGKKIVDVMLLIDLSHLGFALACSLQTQQGLPCATVNDRWRKNWLRQMFSSQQPREMYFVVKVAFDTRSRVCKEQPFGPISPKLACPRLLHELGSEWFSSKAWMLARALFDIVDLWVI